MSVKEVDRLAVVRKVSARRLRQREAAEQLGLSVRQVKRLLRRYRDRGAAGLVSRRRGRRPNNAMDPGIRREVMDWRCQTNWIGPIGASIEGSQAASWRHSARAAVRCCLKTSRRVRWRWWLKWLWIEAWTAAIFCRVLMSLNRAIAPSRLRNG